MREPLRVAVVSRAVYPFHGYGGLERHVCDLVRHVARRGIRVTLITRPPTTTDPGADVEFGGMDRHLTIRTVPYTTFPLAGRRGTTVLDRSTAYPLFGLRAGRLAARLADRGEIDIVHGLGASVLGYALAPSTVRARVPLVFNPQGLEEFGGTGRRFAGGRLKRFAYAPLQWAVRRCSASASVVIATDRALEPAVQRYLRVPRERIQTIPNAIDLDACDALAGPADGVRMRKAAPGGRGPVLVSAGRIERNKGFQVLAEALGRLRDRPWSWVLVGDGPFRPSLERGIAAHGLEQRVLLAGRVPPADLHAWYEAADLFVHPTLYEGSSLVTLEAMAHRRAVVATTAGGLPDKVRPGTTGWLVPPGDPGALAATLAEALQHATELPRLGVAARALVEQEFSWTVAADRTIALYRTLIPPGRIG
jgi:glycosyltransferase involved in cell wall biosynthesis